ncbi:hypothetical protein B0H10DRAFT_417521 [Mycena sp. CBHHK59/15]|nr:hypothetical protein B0H10DRAFT_417521 [Mycena sp. CBHHK59/15]
MLPRKTRKSVTNLFDASNEAGPAMVSFPRHDTLTSTTELSPLRFDTSPQSQSQFGDVPFHALQSELGDKLLGEGADPFLRPSSLYSLSFTMSPSPSPKAGGRSLRDSTLTQRPREIIACSRIARFSAVWSLRLELPTRIAPCSGNTRSDTAACRRHCFCGRAGGWTGGFPTSRRPKLRWNRLRGASISGLPRRLTSALDLVMENFAGPVRGADEDVPISNTLVLDSSGKKQTGA